MNVEKETGSIQNERNLQPTKTNLDINKLLKQMGINPEKWLQLNEKNDRK